MPPSRGVLKLWGKLLLCSPCRPRFENLPPGSSRLWNQWGHETGVAPPNWRKQKGELGSGRRFLAALVTSRPTEICKKRSTQSVGGAKRRHLFYFIVSKGKIKSMAVA